MDYDIFVSYATDDWQRARDIGATLERAPFTVFLDRPLDPERSPVEVLATGIARWVKRSLLRRAATAGRRSEAEILQQLRRWLADSRCLLVLWSGSHRGSPWASREIDIFERDHIDRPIFVIFVDRTPWARPTTQWIPLADAAVLTRDALAAAVGNLKVEPVGEPPGWLDVLLRPVQWTNAVRQRRWGTTSVELLALAGRTKRDDPHGTMSSQRTGVLHGAVVAVLLVTGLATLLTLGALDVAARWTAVPELSRHVMLTTTTLAVFALLLSVQTESQVLLAALVPAAGIALATQLSWSWWTSPANGGAGPGAGAVFGALGGGVLFHSWHQERGTSATSVSRARLGASIVATVMLVVLFAGVLAPLQTANGQLHNLALAASIAAAMLLPALALWREVSRTGRARDVLVRGSASSALLFASAIAVGWLFDRSIARFDQQTLWGGAVAGLLSGLCGGAIALAPGALFGDRVDRHPRVVAAVAAVSLSLVALSPLLAALGVSADFVRDTSNAAIAYAASMLVSVAAARAWIGVRGLIAR